MRKHYVPDVLNAEKPIETPEEPRRAYRSPRRRRKNGKPGFLKFSIAAGLAAALVIIKIADPSGAGALGETLGKLIGRDSSAATVAALGHALSDSGSLIEVFKNLSGVLNGKDTEVATAASLTLPFEYAAPVAGAVTSNFGARDDPITGEPDFHSGVDIAADIGTPVLAFADGEVIFAGSGESLGNYLIIKHGEYSTLYAHCSELSAAEGDTVGRGQLVALTGDTGRTTGPHLHFELRLGDEKVDPLSYLRQ